MASSPALPPELPPKPADAPRRCFVCLVDQSPSDPPSSWVDPCPCTLEAHQDCILSWVTDCERSNKPLLCPVCKSKISLEGTFDPLVALDDALRKRFAKASPLALFTGATVGVQFSLHLYGAAALWAFAGKDVAQRFVWGTRGTLDWRTPEGFVLARRRLNHAMVLMNVAPVMLAARMLPNLSNKIFMPMASVYGMFHALRDDHFFTWPPSPDLAIAVFPYIRSVYYALWREFVLPTEVRLNRQIMGLPAQDPRAANRARNNNQANNNNANGNGNAEAGAGGAANEGILGFLQQLLEAMDPDEEDDGEGGGALDVEINIDIVEDGGEANREEVVQHLREEIAQLDAPIQAVPADGQQEGNAAPEAPAEGEPIIRAEVIDDPEQDAPAVHLHIEQPQQGEQANVIPPPAEADPDADHEVPPAPPARRPSLGVILLNVSNAIVSTLILPGVSFAFGEALRLVLPRAWTSSPVSSTRGPFGAGVRPGLLQQQWGRSLVGGCLYVVLKDALRVYAKYRRVAAMEHRRVKNVDRKRRK